MAERIGADRGGPGARARDGEQPPESRPGPALGLDDSDSQAPASPAHGSTNSANEVVSESDPASAIRIRLDTTENARSRRRGTSKACSTCTHRNSDASGMPRLVERGDAANLAQELPERREERDRERDLEQQVRRSPSPVREPVADRCEHERCDRDRTPAPPPAGPRPAAIAISTRQATTTRIAIESSGGPEGFRSSSLIATPPRSGDMPSASVERACSVATDAPMRRQREVAARGPRRDPRAARPPSERPPRSRSARLPPPGCAR